MDTSMGEEETPSRSDLMPSLMAESVFVTSLNAPVDAKERKSMDTNLPQSIPYILLGIGIGHSFIFSG
jgi:hypothetical protein